MKTPNSLEQNLLENNSTRMAFFAFATLIGLIVAISVQAANQTWTNAPVSPYWTNINNWVGRAVPGDVNNTTANTVNADVVTFNSPLAGGIGGAANPIIPDDATVANGRSRRICGIVFDTTNCGAYVLYSPSPAVTPVGVPATGILYVSHNSASNALAAIRINDSVTNSQAIVIPMLVNLPASTPGIYNLVNNSTNPGVTLTVNSLTHDGATTRGTTYIMDGTNTADNVVTNLSEGPSAGGAGNAGGITKQGPGTWIIAGPGTFVANSVISVTGGKLIVRDPGAFGATLTTAISVTNALLQIDGVTLNQNTISLQGGGTVRMNGTNTVNGISVPNVAGTSATLTTTSASDVITIGSAVNRVTGGAATSVLHLTGPGTILLDFANNFAGRWSLDAGTNQLTDAGALGLAANYTLNAGAVLDLTPLGPNPYAFTPKALNANGTGTAAAVASTIKADPGATVDLQSRAINLTFTPTGFSGDSGHAVLHISQGTLSCNGNAITVNNASGTPLGVGTYQLVHQATGNIISSGAFVTVVTGSGLAAGTVGEIVASGGDLNLLVTAYTPKSLVWTGNDPILPGIWDRLNSTNWLSGITPVTFNIYDSVTFDATGISQPVVTLAATMVPGSVTVDTSAGNYTFTTSTSGQIAGSTMLIKKSAGTLFLNTANTYSGGTVISNGTIKIGIDDAIPSTGSGDVTNVSPSIIDLNGFSDTIGALNGNGTVDVTGGGTSTLTVGANDNSGTFSGVLQNTGGTLALTKAGLGTETLTRSNSYTGATDIEQGTLKVTDSNGLGAGASAVTINGGILDMATNLAIASLAGTGGTIANNSTTTTNTLTIQGTATTSFGGSIVNGSSGRITLKVLGGSLRMLANNTYTNGTFVGSGATFQIHNNPAGVTGPLIASNTATLGLSGGASTPAATPTSITTVDNATVTFASGAEGEIWGGQFLGSATATNRFTTVQSVGGTTSFSNFLGLVQIALTTGNFRFFNGGSVSGGDNTTFEFDGGNVHTRDAQIVTLGAVVGGSSTAGIGGNGTAGTVSTWVIGAKNVNCSFEGYISGSNNVVKSGSATLTLDGAFVTTNTDNATFTNYLYVPALTYAGNTTVSNGVLVITAPNQLTNSTVITLAAPTAVLDASQMGYVSNLLSVDDGITPTNSFLVTNGLVTINAGQTLAGRGIVKSSGVISSGAINPGSTGSGGTLSISNSLTINAGATNFFDLSDDLSGLTTPSDMITVQSDVNLSGNSVIAINALNGVLKVGTYPLIRYGGNLKNEGGVVPPGPISNFTLGGVFLATSRATMVLSNGVGEVDLIVISINNHSLTWTGDNVSNWWDVITSPSWNDDTTSTPNSLFYQLDNVTFNDTGFTNFVTLQGFLAPSAITLNNSITNYTFAGTGSIGGTPTLVKNGSGSLTLINGANSFNGGTLISNGIVALGADSGGNQNDLGLGTGPVSVNGPTAQLRFGGNSGAVVNHFVTNSITVNGGIVKAQDGVQHLTNSTVTVTAAGGTLQTAFATKNLVLDSPLLGTGNLTVSAANGTNATGGQVVLNNPINTFSGSVAIATNANLTLVGSAGLSNSPTIDVQLGGVLDVTGRSNALVVIVAGQTLKGNGVIRGNLATASGSTLSPGASIGTLTATNAGTTVTLGGTTVMEINRSASPNSDRLAATTNVFGGTLTVNNIGGALVAGDTFTLFTSVTNRGAFAITNLPSLASGLTWNNSLTINGKLTVVATVNTTPTNIVSAVTNGILTLQWPLDHTGWRLQVQTNSIDVGLRSNWVDVANSTTTNLVNVPISTANGSVFYRMVYP